MALSRCVSAEENGGAEDTLKGHDQPTVLGTALLHSEHVKHLRRTPEGDGLFLLSHRERREENGTSRSCPKALRTRGAP